MTVEVPLEDEEFDVEFVVTEQFRDWARAAAEADGSVTKAQGACEDPAINTAR